MFTLSAQEYKIAKYAFGCGTISMAGTEYRAIGTLSQSFVGITEDNSNKCFAGFWNNIGEAPISVESGLISSSDLLRNYPNPFSTVVSIEFNSNVSGFTELSLTNLLGIEVADIFTGNAEKGLNKISYSNNDIPAGVYFLVMKTGRKQYSTLVAKL